MNHLEDDWVWRVRYVQDDDECLHVFPKDWHFGGATGDDPRADPRWTPSVYLFVDGGMVAQHTSSIPFCDHDAKGPYRLLMNSRLPDGKQIHFVMVTRPGADKPEAIFIRTPEVISAAN
jgi:hypothetical protein